MAISDIAFSALVNAQQQAAARPLPVELIAPTITNALANFQAAQEQIAKAREAQIRFGSAQVGTPAAVSVGAAPTDPRRRFLGIPVGRLPRPVMVQPPMAGNVPGATTADDLPPEFLTPDVQTALTQGKQVYYRPASRNFKPATLGTDELKIRQDLLTNVEPADTMSFLSEPDREKAFKGARPKVKAGNISYLPVTDALRQRSVDTYGYDVFEGINFIPTSAFNQVLGDTRSKRVATSTPKEGDQLMDVATTAQLYQDEGLTEDQIKKAPKRLKARDYNARRGRLNVKQRGNNILEILAAGAAKQSAGDAVANGFGF